MSVESAKAFIARMKTDEDFAQKVTACKDADAFRSFLHVAGFEFNQDEFRNGLGDLDDTELENVSGGGRGEGICQISHLPCIHCGGCPG